MACDVALVDGGFLFRGLLRASPRARAAISGDAAC